MLPVHIPMTSGCIHVCLCVWIRVREDEGDDASCAYTHDFRGGFQPLLSVSSDLQQPSCATVVGKQYGFQSV